MAGKAYDLCVVGGGIVGCATAREVLKRHPALSLCILEKEDSLAKHQSGRNSGVMHAGIYYKPGTLKAKLCVRGLDLSYKYFDERRIPYKKTGKIIVAVEPHELPLLEDLYDRGQQNNVRDLSFIPGDKIKDYEPHCKGLRAILSPHTGIVDYGMVTKEFAKEAQEMGADVKLNARVKAFDLTGEGPEQGKSNDHPVTITLSDSETVRCKHVVTCGGLFSDRLAQLSGCSVEPKIVPFRGEYLMLKPERRHLVKGMNIYPVPDPRFPFLGFHFTPRMNGDIWLGPNAVLAYKREGYTFSDIDLKDTIEALTFSGMRKLMRKYFTFGIGEMYRSFNHKEQVKGLQRFIPELRPEDVTRGPAGVRAQAMDGEGNLVDDFVFDQGTGALASRILHVRNAPSPAATSSMAIAEMVADKVDAEFGIGA